MEIKIIAEAYRLALSLGFCRVEDVIKWVDNQIEKMEKPPYEIIDISLPTHDKPVDVCLKLLLVKGDIDEELSIKITLGLLQRYLNETEDYKNVSIWLYELYVHIPKNCDLLVEEIVYITSAVEFAEEHDPGRLSEAVNELKIFLSQFQKFTNFIPS